jgi:hypothetical protein|tara:strand:- start:278 stop:469 length:192 start_codon:yes stop_codon:yes gene_type:complete
MKDDFKAMMLLAKVVDQLKVCISDCEQALEEDLTDGSEDIFEGRKELAESLLELIESEEVNDA